VQACSNGLQFVYLFNHGSDIARCTRNPDREQEGERQAVQVSRRPNRRSLPLALCTRHSFSRGGCAGRRAAGQ
jgi:hypothetical protein